MAHTQKEQIATLKHSIQSTTRALAKKPDLKVSFGAAPNAVSLPPMQELPTPEMLTYTRGVADHAALLERYHNEELHRTLRPDGAGRGTLFDTLENVRVESLGSRHMAGVQHNLYRRYENWLMQNNIHAGKIPMPALVELFARHVIGKQPLPDFVQSVMENKQMLFTQLAPLLSNMEEHIHSQTDYAKFAAQMIEHLTEFQHSTDETQPAEDGSSEERDQQKPDDSSGGQEQDTPFAMGSSDSTPKAMLAKTVAAGLTGDEMKAQPVDDAFMRPGQYPSNIPEEHRAQPYHPFTKEYDEIVMANMLATPAELDYLRGQLDQKLTQFQSVTARLASKLQRLLLARQAREWLFDEEDGMIDNRRLSRVIIHPDYERFYKREKDTEFRDTVVCLLIDNSGSMRGRPITMAAMSADIICRTLERCGVKTEILGFTTREWKGGQTYKHWVREGKPTHPGRLNDLRHIIYKPADIAWRKGRRNIGLMLKDGILKENIDGEAILWACDRLMARSEQRRILMVISDGAPVDDSTLSVNSGNYLDKHLREVIALVEKQMPIELLAIGIGHDVTRYYQRAVTISDIEKLGETMTQQLASLFDEDQRPKRAKPKP
ncbi:MAG: hypothetical protein SFT92_00885 [Rickettsiales bacterium]|nr:hypothetical protein [Rickettsiales bacterium]